MGIEITDPVESADATVTIDRAWRSAGLTVGVIIASHNYREFVPQAIESVLAQTYRPDQIVISDDASTDGSANLIREGYADLPGVELRLGEANLGIEEHFNSAVSLLSTDVVIILGADDRLPPHYVQRCLEVLVADAAAGIAYTDFAYFGSMSADAHARLPDAFRGDVLSDSVY